MAMNGWASPEPKWWLNLQANPDATLEMADGTRRDVTAHAATGEERERLWALWNTLDEDYEGYTKMRSGETAIVVLKPRGGGAAGADTAPRRSGRGRGRARNARPGSQPLRDPVHDVLGIPADAADEHRRERVLEQDAA